MTQIQKTMNREFAKSLAYPAFLLGFLGTANVLLTQWMMTHFPKHYLPAMKQLSWNGGLIVVAGLTLCGCFWIFKKSTKKNINNG